MQDTLTLKRVREKRDRVCAPVSLCVCVCVYDSHLYVLGMAQYVESLEVQAKQWEAYVSELKGKKEALESAVQQAEPTDYTSKALLSESDKKSLGKTEHTRTHTHTHNFTHSHFLLS